MGIQYRGSDRDALYAALEMMTTDRERLAVTRARAFAIGARFDSVAQHAPLPAFVEHVVARKQGGAR